MISLFETAAFSFPKKADKKNEDAILAPKFLNEGYFLGVADGVGSYSGGDKASSFAIKVIEEIDSNSWDIHAVFKKIKDRIEGLSEFKDDYKNAATTLSFCYVSDSGLLIGHVGDCRIYMKVDHKLLQLTKDHTQYQAMIDEGVFTKKYLKNSKAKSILTSAISKNIATEYDSFFLAYEDFPLGAIEDGCFTIYIMSDGVHDLWDHRPRFSPATMQNVCKFSNSMLNRIRVKGPKDDHSLVGASFKLNIV